MDSSRSNGPTEEEDLTLPRLSHPCDTVLSVYVQTCVRGLMLRVRKFI